jgi:hypothetical protein
MPAGPPRKGLVRNLSRGDVHTLLVESIVAITRSILLEPAAD